MAGFSSHPLRKSATGMTPDDGRPQSMEDGTDPGNEDLSYLAPLVSRLSLEKSQISENADTGDIEVTGAVPPRRSSLKHARESPESQRGGRLRKASLQKPLPEPPVVDLDKDHFQPHPGVRPAIKPQPRSDHRTQQLPQSRNIQSAKDLDLQDSVDTTVRTKWAPAATHETIRQDTHEVEHRQITREIHEHHVFHRILPIKDVEVLPARHFIESDSGQRTEIPEHDIPNGAVTRDAQRRIAKAFKSKMPKDTTGSGRRQFTARDFPGTDGDYKESVYPNGTMYTEQSWVHAPVLATGAKQTGQTQPFHLGYADPRNVGLRDET